MFKKTECILQFYSFLEINLIHFIGCSKETPKKRKIDLEEILKDFKLERQKRKEEKERRLEEKERKREEAEQRQEERHREKMELKRELLSIFKKINS